MVTHKQDRTKAFTPSVVDLTKHNAEVAKGNALALNGKYLPKSAVDRCMNKIQFESKKMAKRSVGYKQGLNVYQCECCDGWHLTSRGTKHEGALKRVATKGSPAYGAVTRATMDRRTSVPKVLRRPSLEDRSAKVNKRAKLLRELSETLEIDV